MRLTTIEAPGAGMSPGEAVAEILKFQLGLVRDMVETVRIQGELQLARVEPEAARPPAAEPPSELLTGVLIRRSELVKSFLEVRVLPSPKGRR